MDQATDVRDVGKVCAMGESLAHPLSSLSRNDPHRAMVIAEGVAGLCAEVQAWEADLRVVRARRNLSSLGEARASEITDARLQAERAHTVAATRFERSFLQLAERYGPIGEGECPRIKGKDEFVYLFGLVTGTLALLHDRAGGGELGIALDRPLEVARASGCLDDPSWWHTPTALRAGAWATIPGSAPEGVDPWALLHEAAASGEASGIRVARAIEVMLAANAGRTDIVEEGIRAWVAASEVPEDPEWVLLDEYARVVVLHQSDLLWTAAEGHRTERLGALPSDAPPADDPPPDLFGGDDPFGAGVPADVEEEPTEQESP